MQHFAANRTSFKTRTSGIALPVVLMFLVVITILGVVGIRRAITGEALSRNQLDYEVARQSAEAALRDGERDLMLTTSTIRPNALCDRGIDRPFRRGGSDASFGALCPRGQCRFALSYYASANLQTKYTASTVVDPEPWWPTTGGRGGLWGLDADKPSDSNGVGVNCTFNGSVPLGTFTGVRRLAGVARQPEYLIEYIKIGDGTETVTRVTSRGFGANVNTEVVMQSYFLPYLR